MIKTKDDCSHKVASKNLAVIWFAMASVLAGVFTLLMSLGTSSNAYAQEKSKAPTYTGKWVNKKYDSRGGLSAQVSIPEDKKENWIIHFKGEFQGNKFSHDASVSAKKKGNKIIFKGTHTVDGDEYTWSGYQTSKVIYGTYKAKSGNNGNFNLKLSKKKKKY